MVLGIASTAMPFARNPEEQAERWLRILRQHGEVGVALQALGVSDAPRESDGGEDTNDRDAEARSDAGHRGDTVAQVTECAVQIAGRRGAVNVSTVDVLMAVMYVYGDAFDRVLQTHGADRDTVLVLLGAQVREPATG
jgi:hypothetical protein